MTHSVYVSADSVTEHRPARVSHQPMMNKACLVHCRCLVSQPGPHRQTCQVLAVSHPAPTMAFSLST